MTKQWIWKAFEHVRKNPILYLPDIFMTFIISLTLALIYWYTGAAGLFQLLKSTPATSASTITSFLSEKWRELIISGATFFFITFIFGATPLIFKFTMFRELLTQEKISLRTTWKERKGYFWPVIILRIIIFVFGALAFAFAILLALALYFFLLLIVPKNAALGITFALGIIEALCILVYLKLALLFRYPIMFLKQVKNPARVLQESNALLRKDPQLVISTAGVVILLLIIFGSTIYLMNVAVNYGLSFLAFTILATICTALWTIISQILNITVDLWSTMYIFLKWKEEQPKQ